MANIDKKEELNEIGKPIVIATHPRSGTHLTIDLFRKQFRECQSKLHFGETIHHSYLNLDCIAQHHSPHFSQKKAIEILDRAQRPLIKTHSLPQFRELGSENQDFVEKLLEEADLYYVVRDGREVLCSVHLWMQQFDPITRCTFSEFLRQQSDGMSRPKKWAHHVRSWLQQPDVNLLRFEQSVTKTSETLAQIGKNLGIEPLYVKPLLPKRRLYGSKIEDYLLRLLRRFESTAIVGRYRNQQPKKWQQAFTKEDRTFFHQEAGEVLIELGYEVSDTWINEPQQLDFLLINSSTQPLIQPKCL